MTMSTTVRTTILSAALALLASAPLAAQGRGRGPVLSPRDSSVATVGGAKVVVDYSRPSKRGRVIMGELVPYGKVWRTGANEATKFVTSKDLVIGGTTVPAGNYTLYTIPDASSWKLVINKQTGQWGTEYNQDQDLARIDMKVEKLPTLVEQFTIAVEPRGKGGVIKMMWENTQASVPFTVKS